MLVTFKTDVGNITMFGNVAIHMIKLMGHSATIPGAILAADVPLALSRLKSAISAEKASPSPDDDENEDDDEPVVSMADRGLPLINLLAAAAEADCDVMWE
ncbi:MAG TPA: DUF1840 domain-containing protein [Nitrosomonas sp.]|uniref:DUF1840 domain-containing protein n=1 Tax=Nitrosomonas sp. TaxID=42353 RepID=UPI000E96A9AE|nr:DUF1840 domain-containing protein [Nitrosomonas sp.]GJL75143.1 MAG: hypothetical protein NMNS02_12490 [Nitrosomonas sp.]HBV20309.1 DUF1840 domain-containing protein [Nitrosomonas sp.]HNP25913.1 DUF1840 domain-containing protein [Nitrosomonas sp.]